MPMSPFIGISINTRFAISLSWTPNSQAVVKQGKEIENQALMPKSPFIGISINTRFAISLPWTPNSQAVVKPERRLKAKH